MWRHIVGYVGVTAVTVVVLLAVVWLVDLNERIFMEVANDDCTFTADGEPNLEDPDCFSLFATGRNVVREWRLDHPNWGFSWSKP